MVAQKKGYCGGYDWKEKAAYTAFLNVLRAMTWDATSLFAPGVKPSEPTPIILRGKLVNTTPMLSIAMFRRGQRATGPRDKLFGLIGLENLDEHFKVDYNLSAVQVYRHSTGNSNRNAPPPSSKHQDATDIRRPSELGA